MQPYLSAVSIRGDTLPPRLNLVLPALDDASALDAMDVMASQVDTRDLSGE